MSLTAVALVPAMYAQTFPGEPAGFPWHLAVPVLFVGAILTLLGVSYARPRLQRLQANRKREALARLAHQHGWRYAAGGDNRADAFEADFALLRGERGPYGYVHRDGYVEVSREEGKFKANVREGLDVRERARLGRRCRNVVEVVHDGVTVTFFDYFWRQQQRSDDGSRSSRVQRSRGVAVAEFPVALPHLRVWPRGPLARLSSKKDLTTLKTGREEVDGKLLFLTAEPEAVEPLLASPAVDAIVDSGPRCWEIAPRRGHLLLVDQPRVWALEDYETVSDAIVRFLGAAPEHVRRPVDERGEEGSPTPQ